MKINRQQKKQNLMRNEQEVEELVAYGFNIEKLQNWHWRITKPDYEMIVDVWPTKNKLWVVGTFSSASLYTNLFTAIMIKFEI